MLLVFCVCVKVVLKVWFMFIILLVECIFGLRIGLMFWNLVNGKIVFFIEQQFGMIFLVVFCLVKVLLVMQWVVILVSVMLVVLDMNGMVCEVCGFIFSRQMVLVFLLLVWIVNWVFIRFIMFRVLVSFIIWWCSLVWVLVDSEYGGSEYEELFECMLVFLMCFIMLLIRMLLFLLVMMLMLYLMVLLRNWFSSIGELLDIFIVLCMQWVRLVLLQMIFIVWLFSMQFGCIISGQLILWVSSRVFWLLWVMWFGGCFRFSVLISCWKCLWFLVRLIEFGLVLIIGMLLVFSVCVSFSGVWLLYCMIMFFGCFSLMIFSMFFRVSGLKYRWLEVLQLVDMVFGLQLIMMVLQLFLCSVSVVCMQQQLNLMFWLMWFGLLFRIMILLWLFGVVLYLFLQVEYRQVVLVENLLVQEFMCLQIGCILCVWCSVWMVVLLVLVSCVRCVLEKLVCFSLCRCVVFSVLMLLVVILVLVVMIFLIWFRNQ